MFIEGYANEKLHKVPDEIPEFITSQEVIHLHLCHSLGKNMCHFQISDNAVNNEVFSIQPPSLAVSGLSDYLIERIKHYFGQRILLISSLPLRLVFSWKPFSCKTMYLFQHLKSFV